MLVSSQVRPTWTPSPVWGGRLWILLPWGSAHSLLRVFPLWVSHLLLEATGTLQPLTWLSSMSEISICRGSRGAHTVTSNWEAMCWRVKSTIVFTLLFISFPFTKLDSQLLEAFGEGVESWDASTGKTQAKDSNNEKFMNCHSPDLLDTETTRRAWLREKAICRC